MDPKNKPIKERLTHIIWQLEGNEESDHVILNLIKSLECRMQERKKRLQLPFAWESH
jgi:hypothetical protein